ncbi:hypothetical protein HC891_03970 [Candidatus Gracilibacteria bacterium]|nr:hypothetical protein [Candidatus Gracilibacteria bacterium]
MQPTAPLIDRRAIVDARAITKSCIKNTMDCEQVIFDKTTDHQALGL